MVQIIPIKKPNISTNRYKELLQIEKYYHKLQKEDSKLIEEYKDRIDKLYDEIGILEDRIINAIEYIENNDYIEYKKVVSMLRGSDEDVRNID